MSRCNPLMTIASTHAHPGWKDMLRTLYFIYGPIQAQYPWTTQWSISTRIIVFPGWNTLEDVFPTGSREAASDDPSCYSLQLPLQKAFSNWNVVSPHPSSHFNFIRGQPGLLFWWTFVTDCQKPCSGHFPCPFPPRLFRKVGTQLSHRA